MRKRKRKEQVPPFVPPPEWMEIVNQAKAERASQLRSLDAHDVDSWLVASDHQQVRTITLTWGELMDFLDVLAHDGHPSRVRVLRKEFEWVRAQAQKKGRQWAINPRRTS